MKCSQCGERWQDCVHADFEDIQRHKMLRVGTVVSVIGAAVGVVVVCVMVPFGVLF